MKKKIPPGRKLGVVMTGGLEGGDSLFDLSGLTAGQVQTIVDALTNMACRGDKGINTLQAKVILDSIHTTKLF